MTDDEAIHNIVTQYIAERNAMRTMFIEMYHSVKQQCLAIMEIRLEMGRWGDGEMGICD